MKKRKRDRTDKHSVAWKDITDSQKEALKEARLRIYIRNLEFKNNGYKFLSENDG